MNKRLVLALMILSIISLCSIAYGTTKPVPFGASNAKGGTSTAGANGVVVHDEIKTLGVIPKTGKWVYREEEGNNWKTLRPNTVYSTSSTSTGYFVTDSNAEPQVPVTEGGKTTYKPAQITPQEGTTGQYKFVTKETGAGVADTLATDGKGNKVVADSVGFLWVIPAQGGEPTPLDPSRRRDFRNLIVVGPGTVIPQGGHCVGFNIGGVCRSEADKRFLEQARFEKWDADASLSNNLGAALDNFMAAAQFGVEISRLFGWNSSTWEKSMEKFFTENVFGQVISGNWEESFCRGDFFNKRPESVVVADDQNLYYGMHVEGFRSEKGSYYNETTGQTENRYAYMITFRVMNTNDEPNGFNLMFYGPDIPYGLVYYVDNQGLRTDRQLDPKASFTASMGNAFVAQGRNLYDKVCVVLKDPIKDFNDQYRNQVCNAIVVTTGDEGISGGSGHGGIGGEGSGSSGPIQNRGF